MVEANGSPPSRRAVEKAAEIAAGSRAKLIVAVASSSAAEWRRGAAAMARAAGAQDVEVLFLHGDPVDGLVELVRRMDADLLVIGRREPRSCRRRAVADVLRRRTRTQVLVVDNA